MSSRFIHLHLHTEFSLADSTIRVPEKPDEARPDKAKRPNLLSRAVEMRLPALAVTDRNNLFALVKFYKAAESVGIKPIAGADLSIIDGKETPSQLTLLCRDHTGYLSLSRLLTRAWMEGHHNDGVAITSDWLHEDCEGLFAIAGRGSQAGRLAAAGRHEQAELYLAELQRSFGENLHLEITRTQREGEDAFNAFALHAAATRGLPVIASNDVRFLDREGYDAHEARVCISTGRVLDDPKRPREYSADQYLKSPDEMAALFADVPDAIDNTWALAQRCNIEMRLGTYFLPAYPVPAEETLDSWIRSQSHAGLKVRLEKNPLAPGHTREDYEARLDFELDTICKMGFPGYFLIVADFIQWGKNHGIPIGPGRGSGAGSLVAWALQITDLDPLPYGLLFERFLNPERVSMPDFDIDFCMDRRDEVIDYVAAKYGRDRVSQIITYGTMAAKAVVRDAGRVLGFPYGLVDGVAKLIPMTLGVTLKDAMGEGKSEMVSQELIDRYRDEDDVRDLIDLARELEDLTRNAGSHAGGVVIAPTPLSDFCPLFAEHDEGGRGRNPVTQFDKDDVEAVGLVKFDFLGLRTLTIIDWAVKAINQRHARAGLPPVDITTIPLDDASVYRDVFANGNTGSVFQFESSGMRRALKEAKPDRFEDLIALNALYRPGPMDMIPSFVERKHGREEFEYPDPRTKVMLEETYGIMVYQEQVMQMAQIVGGYSLGGADLLRRAMGKKVPAEMAKHREIFREGAGKDGVGQRKADEIFDLMEKFAGYGFNKSHAAAYSLVAYQTAWLKKHYPAEFMAATLSSDMDKTDKVVAFLDECRTLKLEVLPPEVNASEYMFVATDARTVRYGLGAIKGVGRGACEAIASERAQGGPFNTLLDFCKRVDSSKLNRRALEALVNAGALDALGKQPRLADAATAGSGQGHRPVDQGARGRPGFIVRRRRCRARAGSGAERSRRMAAVAETGGRTRNPRPLPQRPSAGSLARRPARPGRHRPGRTRQVVELGAAGREERLAPGGERGDRRPGGGAAEKRRQPDVRATGRRARTHRMQRVLRGLHATGALADPRPHPGHPGRTARGRIQRRLQPARAPLLGLRATLQQPRATPFPAPGHARARDVGPHRRAAGQASPRRHAIAPGPAAEIRRPRRGRGAGLEWTQVGAGGHRTAGCAACAAGGQDGEGGDFEALGELSEFGGQ